MKTSINKYLFAATSVIIAANLISEFNSANAAVVNSLADDGSSGTLRYAVQNASVDPNITFAGGLSGTIALTSGELQITTNVTITGPGANVLAIDALSSQRIFNIFPSVNAKISGLTLQNGRDQNGFPQPNRSAYGGGIYNQGNLYLYQCAIVGCSAVGTGGVGATGGGIYSLGSLAMNACTVSYCSALGSDSSSSPGSGVGGGVYVLGSMTLTNCTLAWNKAVGGLLTPMNIDGGSAGGGAIYCANASGPLAMVNCTVSANQAGDVGHPDLNYGGGITTDFIGSLYLINCIVAGNYQVCCSEDIRTRETTIYGIFSTGGGNILYSSDPTEFGFSLVNQGFDTYVGAVDPVRLWGNLTSEAGYDPTPILPLLVGGMAGGSVAIDAGNDIVLGAPYNLTTDQRGAPRPGLGTLHVDSGAYEVSFNIPCTSCSTYNSWDVGIGGSWDFSSNWGGGPPGPGSSVLITNSGNKTVTIDSFSSSNSLHISDLLMSAPSNSVNSLLINAGPALPLQIDGTLSLLKGSSLDVSNSIIYMHPHGPGPDPAPTNAAFANGSSVIIDGPASFHNNATLDTSSAFDLTIGNRAAGSLFMTNSTFAAYDMFVGSASNGTAIFNNTLASLSRTLYIGTSVGNTGAVSIVGGTLLATNLICHVAPCTSLPSLVMDRGISQLTISSNANAQFGSGLLGAFGGSATLTEKSGSLSFDGDLQLINGTMNLQGGTLSVAGDFSAATGSNSVAQISISGGTLLASNGVISVGPAGTGTMTISNAVVVAEQVKLGGTSGIASGLLRIYSGLLKILGVGGCDTCGWSLNHGEVDGGNVDASATSIVVGQDHNAAFTVTAGTVEAGQFFDGYTSGFTGTYTQSGGTVTVSTNFIVGDCTGDVIGNATLSGGILYATNLIIRDGTFTMNDGTLVVDVLIVTNACGHFIHNGGTLVYNQLILDPKLDADGDGIPNGVEQANGLDPLSSAKTYQVVNNNDSGAGSLRAAVTSANANPGSAISFAPNVTGIITLTSGELLLSASTLVYGPGAKVLAVDGHNTSRVFDVSAGTVTLGNLTITNGRAPGGFGGGIYATNCSLTLQNCMVDGNSSYFGGGLYLDAGSSASICGCAVWANKADTDGAGIYSFYGPLFVTNSTICSNKPTGTFVVGAGIFTATSLVLVNSTIAGNGDVSVTSGFGGGIYCGGGPAQLQNSLIANNHCADGADIEGNFQTGGFNLIGQTNGYSGSGWLATDKVGNSAAPIDPLLLPLADNGGPTFTMALSPGSPAIDQGNAGTIVLDQQQTVTTGAAGGLDQWQSFTAAQSGLLSQIALAVGSPVSPSSSPGTINIYAGEGTSGTLLATASVTFADQPFGQFQVFPLPIPAALSAGNQYTIRFSVPAMSVGWVAINSADPYAGGRASTDPSWDFGFKTYISYPPIVDQRGIARPYDIPAVANAPGGNGSDIGAFELIVPPPLAAARSGNSVIVSWPMVTNFSFNLQQNSNLANTYDWTTSGYPITTANGTNSVTINPPLGNLFFRLQQ